MEFAVWSPYLFSDMNDTYKFICVSLPPRGQSRYVHYIVDEIALAVCAEELQPPFCLNHVTCYI